MGRPVVSGAFTGTTNLGGDDLVSAGGPDILLAKLDAAGGHLWSKRFGSTNGNSEDGASVAVDASDHIALAGHFSGSIDFGTGSYAPDGQSDFFVARFDPQGNTLWSKGFGSPYADFYIYVATDDSGNVAITGELTGPVDFGGGSVVPRQDSDDVFVVLYASSGEHLWSRRYGSIGSDVAEDIAMDSQGNIYITGWFSGTTSFGGDFLTSAGYGDVFVASYGLEGNHRWSAGYGSAEPEGGTGISVAGGKVAVTGAFAETVNFGGPPLTSKGIDDIFLLVLTQ